MEENVRAMMVEQKSKKTDARANLFFVFLSHSQMGQSIDNTCGKILY